MHNLARRATKGNPWRPGNPEVVPRVCGKCPRIPGVFGHAGKSNTRLHDSVYYSLASATSTYQGKVLAFIGDRRATKEPTPICLPTTKTWEWRTGDAVTDFAKFSEFHNVEANKGNLWTPTVGDGVPAELRVQNLLAIPNMLVDLLRNQGSAVTPHDVLASIDDFVQESGETGHHWDHVRN